MTQYRYRSDLSLGPWRCTAEAALEDAIKDGQVERKDGHLCWLSAGLIESKKLYENAR